MTLQFNELQNIRLAGSGLILRLVGLDTGVERFELGGGVRQNVSLLPIFISSPLLLSAENKSWN